MREGWIQLQCADCQEQWDANPADLPSPGHEYRCEHCETNRPIASFVKTRRGYDILQEFHA